MSMMTVALPCSNNVSPPHTQVNNINIWFSALLHCSQQRRLPAYYKLIFTCWWIQPSTRVHRYPSAILLPHLTSLFFFTRQQVNEMSFTSVMVNGSLPIRFAVLFSLSLCPPPPFNVCSRGNVLYFALPNQKEIITVAGHNSVYYNTITHLINTMELLQLNL